MNFFLWHGRLDPRGPGSDLDGNKVEDWGFDGPTLSNVERLTMTYGKLFLHFKDEVSWERAKEQTGWDKGFHDSDLIVPLPARDDVSDCIQIYNRDRERFEYFGDWSCK